MLQYPPALRAGSQVRIVSPAGPVTTELLAPGIETLRSWGLDVVVDDRVYARSKYLAGSDDERLAAINDAIADPDVEAIVFSRGGYGTMRILQDIEWGLLEESPRHIVGFSDITAIHLAAAAVSGICSIHGPVVKSFASQGEDLQALRAALFGTAEERVVGCEPVRPGSASGPIYGGNLSLLAALLSSPFVPDLDGAILFLEDVTEEDYRLDRLFTTLRLSAKTSRIRGIVLGDFSECGGTWIPDEEIDLFARDLATEIGDLLDIPVVAGFPAGHASRNLPFAHGSYTTIDGESGAVTLRWRAP